MQKLVSGITLPLRRLPATGNHYACTIGQIMFGLDGRGEMHEQVEGAEQALSVVNEPDKLTQIRFPSQIDDSVQRWMMVPLGAYLNEENTVAEGVNDSLKTLMLPPLDCFFESAARADYPERNFVSGEFLHLRHPGFLPPRKVQVTPKQSRLNLDIQKSPKVSQKPVYEVERRIVTPLSKPWVAIDLLNVRIAQIKTGKVRVVAP